MKKVENKAECDPNNKYTIHCTNPNCKFDGESKLNIECPDCHEETVVVE